MREPIVRFMPDSDKQLIRFRYANTTRKFRENTTLPVLASRLELITKAYCWLMDVPSANYCAGSMSHFDAIAKRNNVQEIVNGMAHYAVRVWINCEEKTVPFDGIAKDPEKLRRFWKAAHGGKDCRRPRPVDISLLDGSWCYLPGSARTLSHIEG
jgi:hypothetical protein